MRKGMETLVLILILILMKIKVLKKEVKAKKEKKKITSNHTYKIKRVRTSMKLMTERISKIQTG